jgi:hypothetical protein
MKRAIQLTILLIVAGFTSLESQVNDSIEVFFLTVDPGTEIYSIYGHSAIRISIPEKEINLVYNWGIFDFATPNFAWKFSKGRLDYMIGAYSYDRFLQEYMFEERSVFSQKINLDEQEKTTLFSLINENMLPENIYYRYDFFYDNCATRIRDLLEKSFGNNLIYPEKDIENPPTFREKLSDAQKPLPWLNLGINLLIGLPGDKQTSFRERMFLPGDLMKNLSLANVKRNGSTEPILKDSETVLFFELKTVNNSFFASPLFVFCMSLIIIILLTVFNKKGYLRMIDFFIFSIFSILSVLMIFFTFFTDHLAMKMNMNVIWINPLLIMCFICLFKKESGKLWFKMLFFISLIFLLSIPFIPQYIDRSFIPLIILIIVRSFDLAGFKLDPLKNFLNTSISGRT